MAWPREASFLLHAILLLGLSPACVAVKVFDSLNHTSVEAELTLNLVTTDWAGLTACWSFMVPYPGWQTILQAQVIGYRIRVEKEELLYRFHSNRFYSDWHRFTMYGGWTHVCVAANYANKSVKAVQNGQTIVDKTDLKYLEADNITTMNIGPLYGKFCCFNMWKTAKTEGFMTEWTAGGGGASAGGGKRPQGDVVGWDSSSWANESRYDVVEADPEVAFSHERRDVFVVRGKSFFDTVDSCRLFGASLLVAHDKTSSRHMRDLMKRMAGPGHVWAGYTDEEEEGVYRDVNTDKVVTYIPWDSNFQQTLDKTRSCALLLWGSNYTYPVDCSSSNFLGLCRLAETVKRPRMYGSCPNSKYELNLAYHVFVDENWNTVYRGYTDWDGGMANIEIKQNLTYQWEIYAIDDSKERQLLASLEERGADPLGTQAWTFRGNFSCADRNSSRRLMSFSFCDGNDFSCFSALDGCRSNQRRCDYVIDCDDLSDETDCQLVQLPAKYDRRLLPPFLDPDERSMLINVSINVENVLDVSEEDMTFTAIFTIVMSWYDSRLQFNDLKLEDQQKNSLNEEDVGQIWTPTVYYNENSDTTTSLLGGAMYTSIRVTRQGNYTRNPKTDIIRKLLYTGKENYLTKIETYTLKFICQYNFFYYPFDTQRCSMVFALKEETNDFLNFRPEKLSYSGPVDLLRYKVRGCTWGLVRMPGGQNVLKIDLVLGREIISVLFTTYLPTLLLNIINHSTNYYGADSFEAKVTVNLSSMIVLASMYVSASNVVPSTYVKFIDFWLVLSIAYPFIEVLLHTFIRRRQAAAATAVWKVGAAAASGTTEEMGGRVDRYMLAEFTAKTVLPLAYTVFMISYWIYGLVMYSSAH